MFQTWHPLFNSFFAQENMKKPASKDAHNRPNFYFSIANQPKISPNLIFCSIKMAPCRTSILWLWMGWFFESRILLLWHNIHDHFDIQTFLNQSEALVLTNLEVHYLAHLKKILFCMGNLWSMEVLKYWYVIAKSGSCSSCILRRPLNVTKLQILFEIT